MPQTTRQPGAKPAPDHRPDEGFMLIACVVMVFLVLLALSVAAPRLAQQLKRDREVETAHRANQYVRAIRMYYKKFQSYPGSMEALKKSNNIRFLRQEYVDPLTGEKDWKLIHVGQNKTKVKGFFGEDLPGLTAGLGSAAGMSSSGSGSSAFGSTPGAAQGTGTSSSTSASAFGSSTAGAAGTSGTTGSANSTGSNSSFGTDSGFGSSSLAGTGGPFIGVGVPKSGDAILVVNEQTTYQDWEFLYDPRIEQMYAKGNLLGGGVATSGSSSGLGSAGSLGSGFGSGAGASGSGSSGSSGAGAGTPTTPPTTPP